jgi:phosphoenolpyruvate carboxylase
VTRCGRRACCATRADGGDEIENALSYYRATFLRELPALYGDIEAALAEHGLPARVPAFFQMGSWIGGDRDGNPNVTAATLEKPSPPGRVLRHYLDEVHNLGAELSLSACWWARRRAAGAGRASPDQSPHRATSPTAAR